MSKRNYMQRTDGLEVAAPMQMSAAIADTETGERETSFTQGASDDPVDDADNDAGADAPPDEPIDPHATEKAAKRIAFREYCKQYPDIIHNFELSAVIADPKRNVRFIERTAKDPAVIELAAAIKSAGRQIIPGEVLLGLDDNLYVNDGAGRYLALMIVNATRQPADQLPFRAVVIIESGHAPMQSLIDQAQINWHREGLTVLDQAKIVGELKAGGMRQAEIARQLGIKPVNTSLLAKVAAFPDTVKQWIVEGKITATAAYDLAVEDPSKVEARAQKMIDEAGGKRVTRAAVNHAISKAKDKASGKAAKTASAKGDKPAKPTKSRQRTAKQILMFIEDEATDATNKKFGDKNLSKKLECFKTLVNGVGGDTFLKNLAAL